MPCPKCNHLLLEHDDHGCKHSSCECSAESHQEQEIQSEEKREPQTMQDLINIELQKPENNVPGEAILIIVSNTKWSGVIMDINHGMHSRDGNGDARIPLNWLPGGRYNVNLQKKSRGGYLGLAVILGGKQLAANGTNGAYGVVSIIGPYPQLATQSQNPINIRSPYSEDALSILKRRFAKGEIKEEEFMRMKQLLES